MSTGSDQEPANAAAQMRQATRRLRDRAWMVAPLTNPLTRRVASAGAETSWTTPAGVTVRMTLPDGRELTPDLRELIEKQVDAEPGAGPGVTRHIVLQYGADLPVV